MGPLGWLDTEEGNGFMTRVYARHFMKALKNRYQSFLGSF
jgi:protoporphyrinogen oxidase